MSGDLLTRANRSADRAVRRVVDAEAHDHPLSIWFSNFASSVAHATGKPITFAICCVTVVAWAVTGPIFHYSDTWQLVINTGTTIVTFLMVFLIQNTQNRDGAALQAKLDELIRATQDARNTYMGIENLSEEKLSRMRATSRDTDEKAPSEAA